VEAHNIHVGHNSSEDKPWINTLVDFTAKMLKQNRIRTIGVCFGHQIVGRAMGVKVGRNEDGWEVAVNDVALSESGKRLFGKDKLVMLPYSSLRANPKMFPSNTLARVCTSRIVTLSTTTQRVWNGSVQAQCAGFKACTRRGTSLPCKAIRNSMKRS
jgi:anthranilate/para-aminobenzoate synthase component II